jgi:hypothetical protein
VSNSEAYPILGVNRRTGNRRRHGRTITTHDGRRLHNAPVITTTTRPISPRFLDEDEGVAIADLRRAGHTIRAIARQLRRDPSTVAGSCAPTVTPTPGCVGRSWPTGEAYGTFAGCL